MQTIPTVENIIDEGVIEEYAESVFNSPQHEHHLKSENFWQSLGVEVRTESHVALVQYALRYYGIEATVSGGPIGRERPDDWIILRPISSPASQPMTPLMQPVTGGGVAGTNAEHARHWSWWIGRLILGFLALTGALLVLGVLMPIVIVAAAALIGLAWKRPDLVRRMMDWRIFSRLPAAVIANPMRFALITAAITIPLSLYGGTSLYGIRGGSGSSDDADLRSVQQPTEVPAVVAAPTATETQSEPAEQEVGIIDGLAAVDVTSNLEDRGFDCSGPDQGQGIWLWTCTFTAPDGSFEYAVDIMGSGTSHIHTVDATVFNYSVLPNADIARDVLGYIATLPYKDAQPATARSWVEAHLRSGGETTIGSAKFALYNRERTVFLEILGVR